MKPVLKILKWVFLCTFVVMVIGSIAMMVEGDKDGIYGLLFSLLCIVVILLLSRKRKPSVNVARATPKAAPVQRRPHYKGFNIEGFNVNRLYGLFRYNDEFDYEVSDLKDSALEDWPIYKFKFELKPRFTRSETGALRIMAEDRVIGDLSEENALAMKEFINTHNECKPLLEIEGGEYKMYDSLEEKIVTGKDPWTAKLLVSYYE